MASRAPAPGAGEPIGRVRRRLSVVSDNKLVEGFAQPGDSKEDDGPASGSGAGAQRGGASSSAASGEARGQGNCAVVAAYAGVSKKGYAPYNPQKKNQDSLVMREEAKTGSLMLGVLDGHGEHGDLVSQYFRDRLPDLIFSDRHYPQRMEKAMVSHFDGLEQRLLDEPAIDSEFSGTTAVVGVIHEDVLKVANIGDSRLIIGKLARDNSMAAVEVSIDQKPDRADEEERIRKKGGRVFAVQYDDGVDGPARVWLKDMDIPGLAMSRSLGDVVAHSAGVVSEPELFEKRLSPRDRILVVASDGLFEFVSNQEVIDIAAKYMSSGPGGKAEPGKAVNELVAEAEKRWLKEENVVDDTTVIVAYLAVPQQ